MSGGGTLSPFGGGGGESIGEAVDKIQRRKAQKSLISSLSKNEDLDEITRSELLAKIRSSSAKRNIKKTRSLLRDFETGANPTFVDRAQVKTQREMAMDRPGRRGLLGL